MAELSTREKLQRLGLQTPFVDALESGPASPMAAPLQIDGLTIVNPFLG